MSLPEALAGLIRMVATVDQITRPVAEGGIPALPGLYAWWARAVSIPGLSGPSHPTEPGLELLYVGIAPKEGSPRNLRKRVLEDHVGGNIGSSTFRKALCALLLDSERLTLKRSKTRVVLPANENLRLNKWMRANLRLSWYVIREPWKLEGAVVTEMNPPLNHAGNSGHPYFQTLDSARQRLNSWRPQDEGS